MVNEVVDKEVTKVVEEVNKKLVKEVNEGLVLVCRCGDGREVIIKLMVVIEMMWRTRSTRRLTRRWPPLSTSWWLRSFGYFWRKC